MRKPGVAWLLVPRSHVVGDAQRDSRGRMIFREHNPQAVFQRELLDGNLHVPAGAGRSCGDATAAAATMASVNANSAFQGEMARFIGCSTQTNLTPILYFL